MAQTNYKCGISFTFSGTEGTDWAEEYFYHDRLVSDRRAVWIKATTQITLAHNERNLSRLFPASTYRGEVKIGANGMDGVAASGDEGVIRYKVDMDMAPKWRWYKSTGVNQLPAYSAPLTFATLQFPGTATGVLGVTGPVPAVAITDKTNYYVRGLLDTLGDEWHTLTVADDDSANYTEPVASDAQFKASDGRVMPFVVDPKTPHLSITVTGDAQFYTRPPKLYFVPKIHEMVSYIAPRTGTVTITLRALTGADVFWRIGGGSYTNGGPVVTLTHANFSTGSNTLEYYYNVAYVRTRVVIKNPTSPALASGEAPGHLLWGNQANLDRIQARMLREPYLSVWNSLKASDSYLRQKTTEWDAASGRGYRLGGGLVSSAESAIGYSVLAALPNAWCALNLGWTAQKSGASIKTFARYAKEMMLENVRQIDSVGSELNYAAEACPSGPINYRGYWDAQQVLDIVGALDLLSAHYREDQIAGGITPIEEIKVRDDLAGFVVECFQWMAGGRGDSDAPGMWGLARNVTALAIAIALPTYSNSTFGTSGFNGSTTTYLNTPFPATQKTWKQMLSTDDFTLGAYPEPMWRIGITGNGGDSLVVNDATYGTNVWFDKIDYMSSGQMGQWLALLLNLAALHTGVTYTALEAMMLRCANGTLYGVKSSTNGHGPVFRAQLASYTRDYPTIAAAGIPAAQALVFPDENSTAKWVADYKLETLLFYDDTAGNTNVENVVITPAAGTYESARTVTLYCPTAGSTIHYTTNGSTPTSGSATYTAPLSVPATGTIKAMAIKSGSNDSGVTTATYTIDTSGRPAAPSTLAITP